MKLTCQQIEERLRASFETLDEDNPIFVTHEDFLCEVAKIAREQLGEDSVVVPDRNPRFPENEGLHAYTWSVRTKGAHSWRTAFEVVAQVKLDSAQSFIVYGVSVK